MSEAEEWVTVATAADRLGLSERQARRLVDRLPEEERTATGIRPTRVRWNSANVRKLSGGVQLESGDVRSLPAVMSEQLPDLEQPGGDLPPKVSETSPAASGDVRRTSDANGHPEPSALGEAYRAEVVFLRSELTAARETHAQEIERRDVAEGELRRLLLADREEIRRLRTQLAIEAAPTVEHEQQDAPGATTGHLATNADNE